MFPPMQQRAGGASTRHRSPPASASRLPRTARCPVAALTGQRGPTSEETLTSTHQVTLDVFEGPFDLLLELIARRRLDITDVDLAEITADFLASLTGLEDLDLEAATRFLVVAATLMELKAARLLPADQRDELDDLLSQARDVLYARLLEYRAFRRAADQLARLLDGNRGVRAREVALEPALKALVPDTGLPVDATGLAAVAAAVTAPRPDPDLDVTHIRQAGIGVRTAAYLVLEALRDRDAAATFADLTRGRDVADRVAFFLALLELYKLGHVALAQTGRERDLSVRRRPGRIDLAAFDDPGGGRVATGAAAGGHLEPGSGEGR